LVHREASTHSLLNHSNILPFLGIYHEEVDSPPVTILPLIERGSLQQMLAGPLVSPKTLQQIVRFAPSYYLISLSSTENWFYQLVGVASGVVYLHSLRLPIVHGDVHPGNVLIGPAFQLYVCDFGASRIRHDGTRTLSIIRELGKCRFMAPELFMESPFRTTPESDIFALAMLFLNTWSGQAPFHEASDKQAESHIIEGHRPNLPSLRVTLGPRPEAHMWQLLDQMWAQDRSCRPS
ncbi:kinase-like protein, partial [Clavulina sp. PMI_390]